MVVRVDLVLDDIELKTIEHTPHSIELILRFNDDLVESVVQCSGLLIFAARADMPLVSPAQTGCADPAIQYFPLAKIETVSQPNNVIHDLRFRLFEP